MRSSPDRATACEILGRPSAPAHTRADTRTTPSTLSARDWLPTRAGDIYMEAYLAQSCGSQQQQPSSVVTTSITRVHTKLCVSGDVYN